MKKLIIGVLALNVMFIGLVGCEKETTNIVKPTKNSQISEKALAGYTYVEASRSYVWVENNTKLDCSADGSGCTVSAKYKSDNSEVDLTVAQVLKLMDIGRNDLNTYFKNNDLSYEFPSFYETTFFSKITSGSLVLVFEFPYLKIFNSSNALVQIYNYESTLSNNSVIQKLQATGYTKKISVNTGTGGPWKCTEAGDNCKVSSFKFNVDWLARNPQYAFVPGTLGTPTITKDNVNSKILIKTGSGIEYGLEL